MLNTGNVITLKKISKIVGIQHIIWHQNEKKIIVGIVLDEFWPKQTSLHKLDIFKLDIFSELFWIDVLGYIWLSAVLDYFVD